MSSFVSALITFPTLLNIGAALWLLWWTSRRRGEDKAAETTGHVWDGDLTEYNKPLPRWWLVLFVLTVVFGVAYLLLYPGLGNFAGARKWTQIEQYEQQSREAEAVLAVELHYRAREAGAQDADAVENDQLLAGFVGF